MRTSVCALALFCLVSSLSWPTSVAVQDSLLQCLQTHSEPSYPISAVLYTPQNSSFPSVLQTYIRNLRFNESTTRKPLLIITALHVSHIQAAIFCGKANGVQLKTRSGGHDYEGLSYVSDVPFFILDMFNLRSIEVNMAEETAWVQVGATLGEVFYRVFSASNGTRGFPAGVCPTVGVGGHFSGGGYGNMMRKYGLSVDNIVDAEIINVNGRVLNRKSMGEDLFWAITGGGGVSFGVVLSYKIKFVPVPPVVTVFQVRRSMAEGALDIVQRWQEVADKLDHDLFIRMVIDVVNNTRGQKEVRASFISLFLGDSTRLLSVMNASFPELGLQKSDCLEMSWLQSVLFWTNFPIGTSVDALLSRIPQVLTHLKRKSDYLKEPMSKKDLEYIFQKMIVQAENTALTFNPYGGRMAEISQFAKPFPHRAGNIAKIQYAANWNEDGVEAAQRYITQTRILFSAMTPFVSKSPREAFLNYRDLDIGVNHNGKNSYYEGTVYGLKYFKSNFNRLVKVKTMVDPDNYFRNEQSTPTMNDNEAFREQMCYIPSPFPDLFAYSIFNSFPSNESIHIHKTTAWSAQSSSD